MGCAASPDDCSLALRGLKTLAVRLKAIGDAALTLTRWLSERPEIERVLHPALPSCPGHEFWKRDFTGSTGVFSIVFQPQFSKAQVQGFVDKLELFEIGYSWTGDEPGGCARFSCHARTPGLWAPHRATEY